MQQEHWSKTEKRVALAAFEKARDAELVEFVAEFKARAAAVEAPEDMWDVCRWLRQRGREHDEKYDYRYSVLVLVLARLVREGRLARADLVGLGEDKLAMIDRILAFARQAADEEHPA